MSFNLQLSNYDIQIIGWPLETQKQYFVDNPEALEQKISDIIAMSRGKTVYPEFKKVMCPRVVNNQECEKGKLCSNAHTIPVHYALRLLVDPTFKQNICPRANSNSCRSECPDVHSGDLAHTSNSGFRHWYLQPVKTALNHSTQSAFAAVIPKPTVHKINGGEYLLFPLRNSNPAPRVSHATRPAPQPQREILPPPVVPVPLRPTSFAFVPVKEPLERSSSASPDMPIRSPSPFHFISKKAGKRSLSETERELKSRGGSRQGDVGPWIPRFTSPRLVPKRPLTSPLRQTGSPPVQSPPAGSPPAKSPDKLSE